MTERLTYQDLDRDELLALLDRRLLLCSQADLLWAKWEVAMDRALKACEAHTATWVVYAQAFKAWRAKSNSRTLAAWEAAEASQKRAERREERLRRLADKIYQRYEKAREARI